ncbi:MAG: PAS domain S-box protein [Flavobacterium sp. JAD_PAG50586_2]|nr:MAG: PAS domain S-box protein [Flavobacterium sp. JAD_PAG50586_2]
MANKVTLSKFSSFRIVLVYAIFSAIYIYTSDYFLETIVNDVVLLSKFQTVKGLGFILITAILLHILVKRNIDKTSAYYQQIINVKQQSASQLRQSQEDYMQLFNHSPLPMWIFDPETLQFILVNEAASNIYGYTAEEYANMTLRDIRPSEDAVLLDQLLSVSQPSNRYAVPRILRHQKKNGDIIMVKIQITGVTFKGKKLRLASSADVTAEMETQNKLVETNSRLQLASEIANLGYWTKNLLTEEIVWSEEIYKIFEVDPKTFIPDSVSISEYYHPDDRASFDPQSYKGFEENTINESERRIITGSGNTKWLLVRQYLTKDEEGNPLKLEGIVLDITKSKLNEQETLERMEKIESQNKALKEISWTQSHLVRAPLANLLGLIAILKESDKDKPTDELLITYIGESAEKMDNIIHTIVDKTKDYNSEPSET